MKTENGNVRPSRLANPDFNMGMVEDSMFALRHKNGRIVLYPSREAMEYARYLYGGRPVRIYVAR